MTKYKIVKRTGEFKRKEIRQGCTLNDVEPKIVETFMTKEEAIEKLKEYHSSYLKFSTPIGTLYSIEEYMVDETEYNADGEFIDQVTWKITPMPSIE